MPSKSLLEKWNGVRSLAPLVDANSRKSTAVESLLKTGCTYFCGGGISEICIKGVAFVDHEGQPIDISYIISALIKLPEVNQSRNDQGEITIDRIVFDNCLLSGSPKTRWNFLNNNSFRIGTIQIKTSIYQGALHTLNFHTTSKIKLREVLFEGTLDFVRGRFGQEIEIESCCFQKPVVLSGSEFSQSCIITDSEFEAAFMMRDTRFFDRFHLTLCEFKSPVDFSEARFRGPASFYKSSFRGETTFRRAAFVRDVNFTRTSFLGHEVSFEKSHIQETANFSHAYLGQSELGWLDGQKATFKEVSFSAQALFHPKETLREILDELYNWKYWSQLLTAILHGLLSPIKISIQAIRAINRQILRLHGWDKVRRVGELKILTRISYVAIILVPILAALWGPVESTIAWWDKSTRTTAEGVSKAIEETEIGIVGASQDLNAITSQLRQTATDLATSSRKIEAAILNGPTRGTLQNRTGGSSDDRKAAHDRNNDSFRMADGNKALPHRPHESSTEQRNEFLIRKSNDHPAIPLALTLLFFSSLTAILGHLVYQLWVPDLITKRSRDEHAADQLKRFLTDRKETETKSRLRSALHHLHNIAVLIPYGRHKNFLSRYGDYVWIPSDIELLFKSMAALAKERKEQYPALENEPVPGELLHTSSYPQENKKESSSVRYPDQERMLVIIEEGALAEYDLVSAKAPWAALISAILYLASAVLILFLFYVQSTLISNVTDWKNINALLGVR